MSNALSYLAEAKSRNSILDYLCQEQRRAVEDPSIRKCLWTTARAGKSTCVLTDFIHSAMNTPNGVYWYFCLTEKHVEEIAWPVIKRIVEQFKINCRFQEQKLRVIFPSGSWIRLFGGDTRQALNRYYGVRLQKAAIDEAAFWTINLEEFIEDTLGPRLIDAGGQLYLMSTPPRNPRGFFDDIIKGFPHRWNMSGVQSVDQPRWSVHSWTALENPGMREKFAKEIESLKRREPNVVKRAWFRRNYLGERVQERGERVYDFDENKNTYYVKDQATGDIKRTWTMRHDDRYVLGIDFGWNDATAFSLNVWRGDDPLFVELESYKERQMRMDSIAARISMYADYVGGEGRMFVVGDYAHRAYFEELRRRYNLPIMVAEKASKQDWIEVYNNDLFMGNIKIIDPTNSPHVAEMKDLIWKDMRNGGRCEMPGAPNDCCDAHIMAYRHAYHYMHEVTVQEPQPGTSEWYQKQEDKLIEELEEEYRRSNTL